MRVRLPLRVGGSSLVALTRATLLIVPSLVASVAAPAIAFALASPAPDSLGLARSPDPAVATFIQMTFWIGGGCGLLLGVRALARAYALRPADLVISTDGLAFEGGEHDGFSMGWSDADAAEWNVQNERRGVALYAGAGGAEEGAFRVAAADGSEVAELTEIADIVRGVARALADPRAARKGRVEVVGCASCGAPLAPTDQTSARCAYCGATTPVPQQVRDRIDEVARERERHEESDAVVGELLSQSTAKAAGNALFVAGALMLAIWAAAIVVAGVKLWNDKLDGAAIALLLGLPIAGVIGLACIGRAILARREALRGVTLALGASPPAGPHGVWACRRCGGPIPNGDGAVVACPHCGAPNVVGIGLGADGDDAAIAQSLVHATEGRQASIVLAIAGVLTLAITAFLSRAAL